MQMILESKDSQKKNLLKPNIIVNPVHWNPLKETCSGSQV